MTGASEHASATEVLEIFQRQTGLQVPRDTYFPAGLPEERYIRLPFSALRLKNDRGFRHDNSFVWCQESKVRHMQDIEVDLIADARNCLLCFIRTPSGIRFKIRGDGHQALLLSDKRAAAYVWFSGDPRIPQEAPSNFILGEAGFIADARIILLNTDCLIGHDALWSDGILAQGSNQHGIVDLGRLKHVDYGRNRIELAPHVWIGRRAILCAGAYLGKGAILGTGALAAKAYPPASIIAGNPGRVIKTGVSWSFGLHRITDAETQLLKTLPGGSPASRHTRWLGRTGTALACIGFGMIGALLIEFLR